MTLTPVARLLSLTCLCGALLACGKDPTETRTSPHAPYVALAPSLEEAVKEAAELLGTQGELHRAAWDQVDGAEDWNALVLQLVRTDRASFSLAGDIEEFCPGYARATPYQQDTCWLRLVSAVARYESHFEPAAKYVETSGSTSVGLLMMNPAHCPNAPTIEALQVAEPNLRCALPRMARLIRRDQAISAPGNKGAAAYWSVLRPPYQQGSLFLGRRPHIQEFTRTYAAYADPTQH